MPDNRTAVMDNGATIADWLGTAATAARPAGMYLDDVRLGIAGYGKITMARTALQQAQDEIDAITARLQHIEQQ